MTGFSQEDLIRLISDPHLSDYIQQYQRDCEWVDKNRAGLRPNTRINGS